MLCACLTGRIAYVCVPFNCFMTLYYFDKDEEPMPDANQPANQATDRVRYYSSINQISIWFAWEDKFDNFSIQHIMR